MSYQGKLALMPYDHYIFVAAYDIEILKAWKEIARCEVMWGARKILFVSHRYIYD